MRLTVFTNEELDHLIQLPERLRGHNDLEGAPLGFTLQPHRDTVLRLSGHHPYYASITCRRLVKLVWDNHTLRPEEVAALEADLKDDLKGQITAAFHDRSREEQQALQRIRHPSRLERIPEGVLNRLIQDGLVNREGGRPSLRSSLMADLIPEEKKTPWLNRRRVMAIVALIGSILLMAQLAEYLLGPLPVATRPLLLPDNDKVHIQLTYPAELRVQEEAVVDVVVAVEPGEAGQLRMALSSSNGGIQFPDSDVEFSYDVEANRSLDKVDQVKILPRPITSATYELALRVEWSPAARSSNTTTKTTVLPQIRALSGLALYVKGAAALLLAVTGFFGLSPSSVVAWFVALWRGRKEGET